MHGIQLPVLDWLLEPNQPAVRYQALRDLTTSPAGSFALKATQSKISKVGWASEILRRQLAGGVWHNFELLHWPKYVSTAYMLPLLVDLGLTAKNPSVKRSCDLLLEHLSRAEDGGFGFGKSSHFCVTGNFARTFLTAGYHNDARVRDALDWIVEVQKRDGGWNCFPSKVGTLDCWEGLSAFAAMPRKRWTSKIKESVDRGAEFYLKRHLHVEGKNRYEPWFRFHYPVHYYYDLLVGLDVLTKLGYSDDSRLKFALDVLCAKRSPDGTWILDGIPPDIAPDDPYQSGPPYEPFPPVPFGLETVGAPSKMITLRALRVLKRVGSSRPTH
jgi:hypothetical protein